ncbi:MAG: hypothetical protein DI607_05280 [Sphingomonas hengshuiensis]|nr:MAG: hypothetical protein DI607_05280 [Sphingomonas hengshuiensis]
MLLLRAAFGVTGAAQAPQARRKKEEQVAAGSCPSAAQERCEGRKGALRLSRCLPHPNIASGA